MPGYYLWRVKMSKKQKYLSNHGHEMNAHIRQTDPMSCLHHKQGTEHYLFVDLDTGCAKDETTPLISVN